MADRAITRTIKDRSGDILALCNYGGYWSPRRKMDIISDIETGAHRYHVPWPDGLRTPIRVVSGPGGMYLRTDRDETPRNNLDDLPDC